jgi:prepilin-type N-terminal cleavage/methylation domain-containing protein
MHLLASSLRRLRRIARRGAFTLIELLTVMAVIAILAGLVISISGYATKQGALARAAAEIAAVSTAIGRFHNDNGIYPHQYLALSGSIPTSGLIYSDLLDPRTNGNSLSTDSAYTNASLELYEALTGDLTCSGTAPVGSTNYIGEGVKQDIYGRNNPNAPVSGSNQVLYLQDPFGNSYGYSTANNTATATGNSPVTGYPNGTVTYPGFNPTFDLWSTGGSTNTPSTSGTVADPTASLGWKTNWAN